ncbi:bifunctional adenosylcobinamide kinase/adenosylcobinamide-phosphate guanylyltransferase [Neobacillus jeddahensis]|uniref:bifunctional adenosylcobinamide kinase/adenosylcobinamide-phosphate guanylyltransferase n=1 Tax=Neobacillus jeddahensis TaxID=1461580 RepID=UPI00058E3293|nr:bifunctional adenosylcobinamide kinase/adenosylcobinamide-phosphate guanylyltransferase [Neobacillus jeddahensis]
MHFVTGGAFNGKRAWVNKTYCVKGPEVWLSAYHDIPLPEQLKDNDQDVIILEGIELWLKELTMNHEASRCRDIWNQCLHYWLSWESGKEDRQLIVIGTDITKGIVPMERENRLWRDVTGWAYQDIAAQSEKVDVIWYGLNQTIKKRGAY